MTRSWYVSDLCRLASAFYHGGVSWLIPNLTVGSVDEEAGTVSTLQLLSGCIAMQDGWEFWYSSCISFCLVVALHSADVRCSNSGSLRAVAVQIFVNFRLWMVAESPFSKETVGVAARAFCHPGTCLDCTTLDHENGGAEIIIFSFLCLAVTSSPRCCTFADTILSSSVGVLAAASARLAVLAETPLGTDMMQPKIAGRCEHAASSSE